MLSNVLAECDIIYSSTIQYVILISAADRKSNLCKYIDNQSLIKIYSHDLNLYDNCPSGIVILAELQRICTDRVKVLTLVQEIHEKHKKHSILYRKDMLISKLEQLGLAYFASVVSGQGCKNHSQQQLNARKKDHLSHFMLRSAFSFNLMKKRWFYLQELRLFKWRCTSLDREGIRQFIILNGLKYTSISKEEKTDLWQYLQISSSHNINNIVFYKVPFTNVMSLINKRRVFVKQGVAYIPERNVISLFIDHFKKTLMMGFKSARQVLADVNHDSRFLNIFQDIRTRSIIVRRTRNYQRIRIHEIENVSKTSFPLCMRRLQEGLTATHHLTNGGRLQYGLFLKRIGIHLNEAIVFWKKEFLKKFDEGVFCKDYLYGILHQFGVVGKRADYPSLTCAKILKSHVGPRDFHGCPYKHLSTEQLGQTLLEYGLSNIDCNAITELCHNGQYQSACRKYFEITHCCFQREQVKSPVDYYRTSRQKLEDENDLGIE